MTLLLGIDLGTTKLTAIAYDPDAGQVVARVARSNSANITSPADRAVGRSEWDANRIVETGLACVRDLTSQLGARSATIAALGITGQQHGTVLLDHRLEPLTPLINWQDRRGNEPASPTREPGPAGETWVERARRQVGDDLARACGCRLQSGFLAVILAWLRETGQLPAGGRAAFIMDLFAARLAGGELACEPTAAGSSGVFDVARRDWHDGALDRLGLSRQLLAPVREANIPLGRLDATLARAVGLPETLQVFPALGDHQASFVGTIADPTQEVLVNVGTGAQVAVYTDGLHFAPPVELRPYPLRGNLLSNVGLTGGWSYQVLERFFAQVGTDVLGQGESESLYPVLNRLAAEVPAGAGGLRCEPTFQGTRLDPSIRGRIEGLSPQNFTPGHLARAVLEGMARVLGEGLQLVRQQAGDFVPQRAVCAGNGLRENPLLAELVQHEFALPLLLPTACEEAAVGAALVAGVGAGVFISLAAAGQTLRLSESHNG
ncbi:MAG: sedoheptulokinase [Planctomycetaceae bacterium]